MKFTIITPTWNSVKTIKRNIDSIHSQMGVSIEHIIVDNLSVDGTVEFVKGMDLPIKIISEKDNGISDAFNKGINNASGEIVGIINSDDTLYSNESLNLVKESFEKYNCDIVHGDMLFIDDEFGTNIRKPLLCSIKKAFPFNHPTMFIKKSVYEKYGLYSTGYRFAMDYELVSRFYRNYDNCDLKIHYLEGIPISTMYAGGVSSTHEFKTILECKLILQSLNLWDITAKTSFLNRFIRIKLKQFLARLNLYSLIKFWRQNKWKN